MTRYRFDTTPEISRRMAKVKTHNGKAETLLAKRLWHLGYRYRMNDKRIEGKPDIHILKWNVLIFVDGELWHGKDWENYKQNHFKRNRDYWIPKIEANMVRDSRVTENLEYRGWRVLRFWEKDVLKDLDGHVRIVEEAIAEEIERCT